MKTGGTTLQSQAENNFSPDEMFPSPNDGLTELGKVVRAVEVRQFVEQSPEARQRIRFYSGNIPFATADLTCPEAVKIAILRDPVERTLSYLRHCRRDHGEHRSLALEEIYEDDWFFPRFMENYQTKIFAMTPDEALSSQVDPTLTHERPDPEMRDKLAESPEFKADLIRLLRAEGPSARTVLRFADRAPTELVVVDDHRLADAKANVERIDVLGVTERFDRVLDHMADRHGWRIRHGRVLNATEAGEVPASFRARIANDCAADIELYHHARDLAL